MQRKFALYFSHSWDRTHINLNVWVWRQLANKCNMLVDLPGENQPDPPYYLNRIEELMRRSDMFLAILPHDQQKPTRSASANLNTDDAGLACSHYILFEIRLAEKADRPRFILYDRATGFKAPQHHPAHVRYVEWNFIELQDHLPAGEANLAREIENWLDWAQTYLQPKYYKTSSRSFILLPETRLEACREIQQALVAANYDEPMIMRDWYEKKYRNDADLFKLLGDGGLLVAELSELGDSQTQAMYSIAHTLFLPSIRLMHTHVTPESNPPIPWLLAGHPKGYQEDFVKWSEPAKLRTEIENHAMAMSKAAKTITSYEEGKKVLESRRYGKHRIFISHNFPYDKRELIDAIVREFRQASIVWFEYAIENRAGEEWKTRLRQELTAATHFIVLLRDGYETSEICDMELKWALKDENRKKIIPFLAEGRTKPLLDLKELHHTLLREGSPEGNAVVVFKRIAEVLENAKT